MRFDRQWDIRGAVFHRQCLRPALMLRPARVLMSTLAVLLVAGKSAGAFADAVYWGCLYKPKTFELDGVTCEQQVSCRDQILRCTARGEALFEVHDFADTVALSPDGQYLVGLSNMGSKDAFWIRSRDGTLRDYKPHHDGDLLVPDGKGGHHKAPPHTQLKIHYCLESVTNVRQWYDAEHPHIRFTVRDGQLVQVIVRGCDGKDVSLL